MLRPTPSLTALVVAALVLVGACSDAEDGRVEETTTTTTPIVSEVGQRRPWDGVILPPHPSEGYHRPTAMAALADLAELGAPNVAIVVPLIQDELTGVPRRDAPGTPTDEALGELMTTAARLELGVVLQLRVELPNGLPPSAPEPAGRGRWFRDYTQLAVHYAELAEEHAVSLLVLDGVSAELLPHDEPWVRVVDDVRDAYRGPVSLAVDAAVVDEVTFWDELDVIGVDVDSPPEADVPEPVSADLEKAWEPVLAELSALAETWARPVVVTRIGFPGVFRPSEDPTEPAPDGQLAAYEALFTVMNQTPAIEGVLVWRWGGDPLTANGTEATYSPEGRPAEEVLRRAWTTPLAEVDEAGQGPSAGRPRVAARS